MVPTNNLSPHLRGRTISRSGQLRAGPKIQDTPPQAGRSLHRYPHRTWRYPLRWITQHHDQGRLDIQRALYTLSPALDESPSTRENAATAGRSQFLTDRRAFAYQLFTHLKNLQTTHRHMLTMFLRNVELAQENIQLKQELSAQQETGGIIGKSALLVDLLSLIRTIAPSDTTVLVTGETGTGRNSPPV